jgi:hypothetical protein
VPSVGVAYDRGKLQTPAWKPLSDAYVPVREWLARLEPDVAIVVYNDHGADFMFDKYPTFALGAADRYAIADEGFGTRPRCAATPSSPCTSSSRSSPTSSTSPCARKWASSTAFSCR